MLPLSVYEYSPCLNEAPGIVCSPVELRTSGTFNPTSNPVFVRASSGGLYMGASV